MLQLDATRVLNCFGVPDTKRDGKKGKIGTTAKTIGAWNLAFEQEDAEADAAILQIVNPKGEMKGSAITGPVGKEAAELWPVCTTPVTVISFC